MVDRFTFLLTREKGQSHHVTVCERPLFVGEAGMFSWFSTVFGGTVHLVFLVQECSTLEQFGSLLGSPVRDQTSKGEAH